MEFTTLCCILLSLPSFGNPLKLLWRYFSGFGQGVSTPPDAYICKNVCNPTPLSFLVYTGWSPTVRPLSVDTLFGEKSPPAWFIQSAAVHLNWVLGWRFSSARIQCLGCCAQVFEFRSEKWVRVAWFWLPLVWKKSICGQSEHIVPKCGNCHVNCVFDPMEKFSPANFVTLHPRLPSVRSGHLGFQYQQGFEIGKWTYVWFNTIVCPCLHFLESQPAETFCSGCEPILECCTLYGYTMLQCCWFSKCPAHVFLDSNVVFCGRCVPMWAGHGRCGGTRCPMQPGVGRVQWQR